MAGNRRKQQDVADRFGSGADLDQVEQDVLAAMLRQATAGNAAAARLVLNAVEKRRRAGQKPAGNDTKPATDGNGLPIIKLRREAIA